MLSEENYDRLNENFLYKKDPDPNKSYLGGAHWCRNWTFKVEKRHDGRAFMYDTYWGSSSENYIEVTNENIKEFEMIFNFKEVERVPFTQADEYERENLIYAPVDSGGMTCTKFYWIKKGTQKSRELQIEKKKEEIRRLESKLEWAERELKELENSC